MSEDTKPKASKKKPENPHGKKIPKRITESYLHNSGLYYLERYSASSAHFRSVMLRKSKRSCMVHTDQNIEECAALIDALIVKFERSGLLNDEVYLNSMITSYRRKGLSLRMIEQKLSAKGLSRDRIKEYVYKHDTRENDNGDCENNAELKAAAIFCRRKKIGSFALTTKNEPEKELARLGRAGFGFDIARKILELDPEEIEKIIYNQ